MTRILKLALIAVIVGSGTGCTTGYWLDRGRDCLDVFTVTGGVGIGAKAKVGWVNFGLIKQKDYAGLRGGTVIGDLSRGIGEDEQFFIVGHEELFYRNQVSDYRIKAFRHDNVILYDTLIELMTMNVTSLSRPVPGYLMTQIDVVVGLGPSVRVGFNPGELLDFILGFVGVDLMGDDLEWGRKRTSERKE